MFVTISNLIVFVLLFIFLNYSGYSKLLIFTIMGFLIIINGPLTLKQKIAGLKLFIFIQSLALIFSLYYFIISFFLVENYKLLIISFISLILILFSKDIIIKLRKKRLKKLYSNDFIKKENMVNELNSFHNIKYKDEIPTKRKKNVVIGVDNIVKTKSVLTNNVNFIKPNISNNKINTAKGKSTIKEKKIIKKPIVKKQVIKESVIKKINIKKPIVKKQVIKESVIKKINIKKPIKVSEINKKTLSKITKTQVSSTNQPKVVKTVIDDKKHNENKKGLKIQEISNNIKGIKVQYESEVSDVDKSIELDKNLIVPIPNINSEDKNISLSYDKKKLNNIELDLSKGEKNMVNIEERIFDTGFSYDFNSKNATFIRISGPNTIKEKSGKKKRIKKFKKQEINQGTFTQFF